LGLAAATWLFLASLIGVAQRLDLRSGSLNTIWHRAAGLPRSIYGLAVAHAGIAVVAAGIAGVSAWQSESVALLTPGQSATLGGYEVRLLSVAKANGPNYETTIGKFDISVGGAHIDEMVAERRFYPSPGSDTTEAAIRVRPLDILYVTLGEQAATGAWTVRMYHHPLVSWIWSGCVIMVLGGLLSLSDRRLRVGAPRRGSPTTAMPAAAE
jgi:cytochrome c-type biogenesis protein CcmF